MLDPARRLVEDLADRIFEPHPSRPTRSHDRQLLPSGRPVGALTSCQDVRGRRRRRPRRARERPVRAESVRRESARAGPPSRRTSRSTGAPPPASRRGAIPGSRAAATKISMGVAVPGRRVDDGLPVGSEPRRDDGAAPEGQLLEGRRRDDARSRRPAKQPRRPPASGRQREQQRRGAAARGSPAALAHAGRPRRGEARQRLEVEGEIARRVEALLRVLLEAVPHDPVEAGLDVLVRLRRGPAAPSSGSPSSCPPPCRRGTRAAPRASRRGSRRRRRCPTARRRACRAPARATCSRSCRARRPAPCRRRPSGRSRLRAARPSSAFSFARPKSRILTRPSFVRKRFSGFRSRWTIPFSCAAASPCAICTA